MIYSPTEKSVAMIWGQKRNYGASSDLLELSGDSEGTLEWKILEQKLQHPRFAHVSFSISTDIATTLNMKSISHPPHRTELAQGLGSGRNSNRFGILRTWEIF